MTSKGSVERNAVPRLGCMNTMVGRSHDGDSIWLGFALYTMGSL